MGLTRTRDLSLRNGEYSHKDGEVYQGGSPLAMDSSGKLVLAKADQMAEANGATGTKQTYMGISIFPSAYNEQTPLVGKQAAIIIGPTLCTFCKLTPNTITNPNGTPGLPGITDDYPYAADAWVAGDEIYIGDDGKWTRTAANAADPYYGTVIEYANDTLTANMFGVPVYKD